MKYKTEGTAVVVPAVKEVQVLERMVGQFGSGYVFQCISGQCFVPV